MQEKLLKKIIPSFAGPESEKLVDLLFEKQRVNEFLIAKKMELTINQTRNMLYKLADEGLVKFIRKKDKKKGGWYTYFWTLETKKSLTKYLEIIEGKITEFKKQLKERETGRHFHCVNCEIEYTEEEAMLEEYTCKECGEILEAKDNTTLLDHIKKELIKLEETQIILNEEIDKLEHKDEKSKARKRAAEAKKKKEERDKRRQLRLKEKAKEEKRLGIKPKKKVKKKVAKKKVKKGKKKKSKKTPKKKIKNKVKKKKLPKAPKKKIVKKKPVKKKKR